MPLREGKNVEFNLKTSFRGARPEHLNSYSPRVSCVAHTTEIKPHSSQMGPFTHIRVEIFLITAFFPGIQVLKMLKCRARDRGEKFTI